MRHWRVPTILGSAMHAGYSSSQVSFFVFWFFLGGFFQLSHREASSTVSKRPLMFQASFEPNANLSVWSLSRLSSCQTIVQCFSLRCSGEKFRLHVIYLTKSAVVFADRMCVFTYNKVDDAYLLPTTVGGGFRVSERSLGLVVHPKDDTQTCRLSLHTSMWRRCHGWFLSLLKWHCSITNMIWFVCLVGFCSTS